jgi:DNA-binding transcriptional LysR family regulator
MHAASCSRWNVRATTWKTSAAPPPGTWPWALPPSVSRALTAPLVKAFREQLPRANLSVVEGLSTYALEWLQIGRVDWRWSTT